MIEDRHARKSTIIASQLPVANWFDGMKEMKKVGINFLSTIKKCLSVLKSFDYFYLSGSWDTRQMILGSVFIEKLILKKIHSEPQDSTLSLSPSYIFPVIFANKKKGTGSSKYKPVPFGSPKGTKAEPSKMYITETVLIGNNFRQDFSKLVELSQYLQRGNSPL